MENKRYTVTLDLYVYEKDDKAAIKAANKLVKQLSKVEDNDASLVSIYETPFGTFENRRVETNK